MLIYNKFITEEDRRKIKEGREREKRGEVNNYVGDTIERFRRKKNER